MSRRFANKEACINNYAQSIRLQEYYFTKNNNIENWNLDLRGSRSLLISHLHSIRLWFDPDKFDWSHSWELPRIAFMHFDIWYYPDKLNWNNITFCRDLETYCYFCKDEWYPDLLIRRCISE